MSFQARQGGLQVTAKAAVLVKQGPLESCLETAVDAANSEKLICARMLNSCSDKGHGKAPIGRDAAFLCISTIQGELMTS